MKKAINKIIGSFMVAALAQTLFVSPSHAHGFAGKRFFPATIAIDDPFVADELSFVAGHRKLPLEDNGAGDEARLPTGNPGVHATTFATELSKRITPDFGISLSATYQRVRPSDETAARRGFDNLGLGLKYQLIKSPEHEGILSLGLDADLGGTGSSRIGAESFSTISPVLFYGKGFGDLPEAAKYLRPLAITGILSPELPTRRSEPDRLNWGFTAQYSLQYLQSTVKDVGLGAPFDRMIALIEVPVKTCLNKNCAGQITGTVNPGLMWIGKYAQVGVEAVIPLNRRSGNDIGGFIQLHLFLDDMFPKNFGQPVFH